jgi:heme-degrading monooxygenase HmoA
MVEPLKRWTATSNRRPSPVCLTRDRGVQLLREDRDGETWFTTISYWADIDAMASFTKGEPEAVHHLPRDAELLIELPERIQIHRILVDQQNLR